MVNISGIEVYDDMLFEIFKFCGLHDFYNILFVSQKFNRVMSTIIKKLRFKNFKIFDTHLGKFMMIRSKKPVNIPRGYSNEYTIDYYDYAVHSIVAGGMKFIANDGIILGGKTSKHKWLNTTDIILSVDALDNFRGHRFLNAVFYKKISILFLTVQKDYDVRTLIMITDEDNVVKISKKFGAFIHTNNNDTFYMSHIYADDYVIIVGDQGSSQLLKIDSRLFIQ